MSIKSIYQKLVNNEFPISKQLGFFIDKIGNNSIYSRTVLKNNINIHDTAFGGSIYSAGILTGWIHMKHLLDENKLYGDIFIKDAHIIYQKPITDDIMFISTPSSKLYIDSFIDRLNSHNKASLEVNIKTNNDEVDIIGNYTVVQKINWARANSLDHLDVMQYIINLHLKLYHLDLDHQYLMRYLILKSIIHTTNNNGFNHYYIFFSSRGYRLLL